MHGTLAVESVIRWTLSDSRTLVVHHLTWWCIATTWSSGLTSIIALYILQPINWWMWWSLRNSVLKSRTKTILCQAYYPYRWVSNEAVQIKPKLFKSENQSLNWKNWADFMVRQGEGHRHPSLVYERKLHPWSEVQWGLFTQNKERLQIIQNVPSIWPQTDPNYWSHTSLDWEISMEKWKWVCFPLLFTTWYLHNTPTQAT